MTDPWHEAKEALATVRREYTSVNSLNAATAFAATLACEATISALYKEVTESDFPYQQFPRHKPGTWVTKLGIGSFYSNDSRKFLNKIDSYCFEKARYEGTPAFEQHVNSKSASRGSEIILGTEKLIKETQELVANEIVAKDMKSKIIGGK